MQHITVRVSRDQPAYMMLRTHSENVFSPVFFLMLPVNLPNADDEQANMTDERWDHIRFPSGCQSRINGIVVNLAICNVAM